MCEYLEAPSGGAGDESSKKSDDIIWLNAHSYIQTNSGELCGVRGVVSLTRGEQALLLTLAERKGQFTSFEQLARKGRVYFCKGSIVVVPDDLRFTTRSVQELIYRLRKKLEIVDETLLIENRYRFGYRLRDISIKA
ncbi:MAG TPA: helix-turn-helix domain-containing protein [Ktedonobacterales bacterium]|nr:helix-turn-helix domain-containing protein [Ktedonobacterales bacterium]